MFIYWWGLGAKPQKLMSYNHSSKLACGLERTVAGDEKNDFPQVVAQKWSKYLPPDILRVSPKFFLNMAKQLPPVVQQAQLSPPGTGMEAPDRT